MQKKLVDLCAGCVDNVNSETGNEIWCACARKIVQRVVVCIFPGDKCRNRHCPHRRKEIKKVKNVKSA